MTAQNAYKKLVETSQKITRLWEINSLLEWDLEINMPEASSEHRGDQMSLMQGLAHEWFTAPEIGDLISACEESDLVKDPASPEAVNIREWRRDYDRKTRIPQDLVEEIARTTAKAHTVWIEARRKSDFSIFRDQLGKIIDLTLKKADAIGYDTEPYDALHDEFEPGSTAAYVEKVFTGLRRELVELNQKIADAPRRPDASILKRHYDVDKQRIFNEMAAGAVGYDFTKGRLDEVTHPFCTSFGPDDVRICTRYYPDLFDEALTGTIHEAGHALYDLGLPKEHWGTPRGNAASLGIHESQSRMWENQVGRSKPFWVYFLPQAKRIFREPLGDVDLDDVYGAFNSVQPSYIRVQADEATYNLHIMLRFEIERLMLNKEIKLDDIPGEWNKRFKDYLGIEVDKDANGVLQDVHWSIGAIGYFPTYCLGNLYAAQFWATARKALPKMDSQFERGDFSGLLGWLRKNIHEPGITHYAPDLCEKVTGEPLSHTYLIEYLYAKYEDIYGIKK